MSEIPQAGIFALGTASHAYLELDLREPRTTIGGVNLVAGLRPELWRDRVGAPAPPALHGFDEPVAGPDGFTMPATQHDAVLWLAGAAYDRSYNPGGVARHLLAMVVTGSRAEGLQRIDIPTAVIHGSVDPLIAVSGGERTAALVPGADLLVLEGMGHDLPPAVLGPLVETITALAARTYA